MNWLPFQTERGAAANPVGITLGIKTLRDKGAGLFVPRGVAGDAQEITNLLDSGGDKAVVGSTTGTDSNDAAIYPATNLPAIIVPDADPAGWTATESGTPTDPAYIETASRVYFPVAPTETVFLLGTGSTHLTLFLNTDNTLNVRHLRDDLAELIGNAASPNAVPSVTGRWVWLIARLNIATAECSYWYSYDDTEDLDQVVRQPLGSAVGSNAGESIATGSLNFRRIGSHTTTGNNGLHYINSAVWDFDGFVTTFRASDNTAESQVDFTSGGRTWTPQRNADELRTVWAAPGESQFQLDGTDDFITLPASCQPSITPTTGGFTVIMLFRTAGTTTRGLFGTGQLNFEGLGLYLTAGSTLVATTRDSGAGAVNQTVAGILNDNVVHAVAGVWDAGNVRAYTDTNGFSSTSSIAALTDVNYGTATRPLVGSSTGDTGVGAEIAAEIKAVAVFQEGLSDSEVTAVVDYLKAVT